MGMAFVDRVEETVEELRVSEVLRAMVWVRPMACIS